MQQVARISDSEDETEQHDSAEGRGDLFTPTLGGDEDLNRQLVWSGPAQPFGDEKRGLFHEQLQERGLRDCEPVGLAEELKAHAADLQKPLVDGWNLQLKFDVQGLLKVSVFFWEGGCWKFIFTSTCARARS